MELGSRRSLLYNCWRHYKCDFAPRGGSAKRVHHDPRPTTTPLSCTPPMWSGKQDNHCCVEHATMVGAMLMAVSTLVKVGSFATGSCAETAPTNVSECVNTRYNPKGDRRQQRYIIPQCFRATRWYSRITSIFCCTVWWCGNMTIYRFLAFAPNTQTYTRSLSFSHPHR